MSTNDFTDNYKKKLDELKNYDDSEVKDTLNTHSTKIAKFEQQKNNLSKQMPWNTVQGESLHIEDAAEWDENSLSIAGNLEQETREGYNLAKINQSLKFFTSGKPVGSTSQANIIDCDDNNIKFEVTSNQYAGFITEPVDVKNGETLYNSFKLSGGNSKIRQGYIQLNDDGSYTSLIINSNVPDGAVKNSYTATADMKIVVGVWTNNDTTYTIDVKELMIAKKDNLMFEQYGAMPSTKYPSMPKVATGEQKIKQFGKNFIKNTATTQTINGVTFTVNEDKTIKVNGTATATTVLELSKEKLLLETGDYVLSGCPVGGGADTYKLDFILKNTETNTTSYPNDFGQTRYIQIKESEEATVVRIVVYAEATLNDVIFRPMLEKGKTATDYEPYAENIETLDLATTELAKIVDSSGNTVAQDKAVYRNGKWQWEKNVRKTILNGTENWQLTGSKIGFFFCTSFGNTYALSNNIPVCSHFVGHINIQNATANNLASGEIAFNVDSMYSRFYLYSTQFETVEELKTFLAEQYSKGTPVTVYYVLATPEYEDCTAEQSAILDKLYNNFALQKDVNNIIVESENLGVEMDLEYMQDLQRKLNALEAMCVSNASQEV